MTAITFTEQPNGYVLDFPFDRSVVDTIKDTVPSGGRRFDKDSKHWLIDHQNAAQLAQALQAAGHATHGLNGPEVDAQPVTHASPAPAPVSTNWAAPLYARLGTPRAHIAYGMLCTLFADDLQLRAELTVALGVMR